MEANTPRQLAEQNFFLDWKVRRMRADSLSFAEFHAAQMETTGRSAYQNGYRDGEKANEPGWFKRTWEDLDFQVGMFLASILWLIFQDLTGADG